MNAPTVCNHEVMVPSKTFGKLMAKCGGCERRKKWPWAKMVKCCQCKKLWHAKCLLPQTHSSPVVKTSVTISKKRFFSHNDLRANDFKEKNNYEQKGIIIHRIKRCNNDVQQTGLNRKTNQNSFASSNIMSIDAFTLLKVLGRGNYGKVILCRHKISKEYVAIKSMKKDEIISRIDAKVSFNAEKRISKIATEIRHPFVINMFGCFQTVEHVCFIMEFAAGGDLMTRLEFAGAFEEPTAVFYTACIVLGLQYLHEKCIVYRDLKLMNLLMDTRGYIKIADFGMCKIGVGYGDRTNTACGTPNYIAPEILTEDSYTRDVDWWALGIVIFEMLVGDSPFKASNRDLLFDAILYNDVNYPDFLSSEALEIVKGLLNKEPDNRLGSSERGAEDVKEQPFFKQIVWDDLLERKVTPPYVPKLNSMDDVSHFNEEVTCQTPQLTMSESPSPLSDEERELFKDFDFTADWFQQKK